MFTIEAAREEANRFRELLEKCDPSKTYLVPNSFPVESCRLASMLLSFHFLKLWPALELKGVSGVTGKKDAITHYWLEVGDYVIDITGDQYNVISTSELNEAIVNNRPFVPVHVAHRKDSYLYNLFKIQGRELLTYGFPTIGNDFIDEMECDYRQLVG
ncbi:hypothetical protein MTZ01_004289 [Escherichia coli]|uniref:hypothetical protein n=1 Tax=Escherichia coli TaxID=562 RepID=UPI0011247AC2|nr:hypothetical protein [Escherichia coli]EJB3974988.1 hypothetical protein [Escherichia coli]ELO3300144.1 hypothetical protein [Escherichia coli]TNR78404.1 hypothetical protein FIC34_08340 [Escherichia coli]HAX4474044.1 hypothetical protein [Escherichia coli]HAX4620438.1 hypothetical protein [Escherichia coli]